MNDLKTVLDAYLSKPIGAKRNIEAAQLALSENNLSDVDTFLKKALIEHELSMELDRMIETPAPQDANVALEWAKYRMNLMKDEKRELQKSGAPLEVSHQYDDEIDIYETICSALQIYTPAPTEKVDVDTAMRTLWDAGYKIHGQFGWVTDDRANTGRLR